MNKGAVVGVVVLLLVIIAGAYLIMQNQSALGSNANLAAISLTDPPHVPNGTTSLMISYSEVQARVVNSSASGWVNIHGSGSVDLLSLINVSQVIANSAIAANSSINAVRFKIASANITINGVTSNVTVPSGMITANVSSGNSTTQVLVDMSPSIVAIYTNSSTVFVMVPSVRAIAFAGNHGYVNIGTRTQLNSSEKEEIKSGANLSITNETVMSSGNSSKVSVTVKNNGNQSVVIRHVIINGDMHVLVVPFAHINASSDAGASDNADIHANASASANVRVNDQRRIQLMDISNGSLKAGINTSVKGNSMNLSNLGSSQGINVNNGNISVNASTLLSNGNAALNETINVITGHVVKIGDLLINGSAITSGNVSINGSVLNIGNIVRINNGEIEIDGKSTGVTVSGHGAQDANSIGNDINARIKTLTTLGIEIDRFKSVNFAVSSNGTMVLPSTGDAAESINGYVLAPGAQGTFTYAGTMTAGNSHILISFVPGSNYSAYVQGEDGANAETHVTAS